MNEKLEVQIEGHSLFGGGLTYRVGTWSFSEEDKDLEYIDAALASWTAFREFVVEEGESEETPID